MNEILTDPQTDIYFMKEAIKQARKAAMLGEVPIGCVIVYNGRRDPQRPVSEYKPEGRIIGRGYNRRNTDRSTLMLRSSRVRCVQVPSYSQELTGWSSDA